MFMGLSSAGEAVPLIDAALAFASAELSLLGVRQRGRSATSARAETPVEVRRGADAIADLETAWREIARSARGVSAFQSYGFARAAAAYHEARGEEVAVAVVERGGRAECILPVAIARRGGLRVASFLGDPLAQYGDALLAREASPRAAWLALEGLFAHGGIDALQLRRVRADAAILPALSSLAKLVGRSLEAPYADLTAAASVEALLFEIGGAKQRRERARSRRRLAEKGTLVFDALRGPEAIGLVREAFAAKSEWLARRGFASAVIDDPKAVDAFARLAAEGDDGRSVVALRLTVGGEPAAYEVGLVHGGAYHAYLGVVTEPLEAFSPGKTLMEETLAWCRANGVDTYDLLSPADAYKRQWSNGTVPVHDFAAPVTLAGRLYVEAWLTRLRPKLRETLDGMPPALRHRLGQIALRAGAR
jgi:CelD/BcsL family acetyltransferase involved in cellulose biosynthesis